MTHEFQTPNGAWIGITPYSDWVWRWFGQSWQLGSTSTAVTLYSNFGIGDGPSGVAAAITRVVTAADHGLVPDVYYGIYAEEQCPGGISCYHQGQNVVYLGWNTDFMRWDSFLKSVVLHEMGHAIQHNLFGTQAKSFTAGDATQALCKCDHISNEDDRQHCIQSREHGGAAQSEGFGHFIGAIAQNNAAHSDAWFPYYKKVLWHNYQEYGPPVGMSAYGWGKWMETNCVGSNTGTELDWTNFFYWIHRRTTSAYTLTQIRNVYRQACGGANCTPFNDTTWGTLSAAVNTLHTATSAKAQFWHTQGDTFGVDF